MTLSSEERWEAWEVIKRLRGSWCNSPCNYREGCGCADEIAAALRAAENEALERAAKVADSMTLAKSTTSWGQGADSAATAIATAIRALKTGE